MEPLEGEAITAASTIFTRNSTAHEEEPTRVSYWGKLCNSLSTRNGNQAAIIIR
jgi:hypothetical protein